MTQALCLNCGNVKFGAICPCPKCNAQSSGDMQLDITFSDHRMSVDSLKEFGAFIQALSAHDAPPQVRLAAFIKFISEHHGTILKANVPPPLAQQADALLAKVQIPAITVDPSPRKALKEESAQRRKNKKWWQFWL